MTELIAHSDAYVKEFKANVTAVNREEGAVALDRTAFYPGGGGQPYDLGWLNQEVAAAHPVKVKVLPRAEAFKIPDLIRTKINLLPPDIKEIRIVEIVGLDLQADGGTHVANTSEVGLIRVSSYKSKGRINKRIQLEIEL